MWDVEASGDSDNIGRAVYSHLLFVILFYFSLIKSPGISVVQENAAMLFC